MWKHILESTPRSSNEELISPAAQMWTWRRLVIEGGVLFGLLAAGSWLVR